MAQAVPVPHFETSSTHEPATKGTARPAPAAKGSRGRARLVLGSVALLALAGLTAWNAGRSPALDRARVAETRGRYVDALQAALEHLDTRPWSRDAAGIAARCLSRLDFAEEAEPHYRTARPLSPEDRHYRAYGYVRANRREQAVAAYREILDAEPADVTALRFLGGVYLSQARWSELRATAARLIALPDRPTAAYTPSTTPGHWTLIRDQMPSPPLVGWTLQAVAYHDERQIEEAVGSFDKVLELDPELRLMPLSRNLFWAHYAEDLIKVGRSAEAAARLERLPEARTDVGLLDFLAQAYLQLSRLDDAERTWRQVLLLEPKNVAALLNLGRLDLQRNRPEPASQSLAKAAELSPDSYEVAYSLSQAYRQLGRLEDARRFQKKAAALDARNAKTRPDATTPAPEAK